MPELLPSIVNEVLEACKGAAADTADAFSRALDGKFTMTTGDAGTLAIDSLSDEFNGPGLGIVLGVGSSAAVIIFSESSGLLPGWYSAPDATGKSKLTTLAQEAGMCVLPGDYMSDTFKACKLDNLKEALKAGEPATDAATVQLIFTAGDKQATAILIWPLAKSDAFINYAIKSEPSASAGQVEPAKEEPAARAEPEKANVKQSAQPVDAKPEPHESQPVIPQRKFEFPPFTRSLLRVRVPVVVTLAEKKQPLSRILDIGPGQIIQFDKSCEEMLELEAGNCRIATGEAVKVGDKFGLRISTIVEPDERFTPVKAIK
jgi:flagellar motor switch protein FliN